MDLRDLIGAKIIRLSVRAVVGEELAVSLAVSLNNGCQLTTNAQNLLTSYDCVFKNTLGKTVRDVLECGFVAGHRGVTLSIEGGGDLDFIDSSQIHVSTDVERPNASPCVDPFDCPKSDTPQPPRPELTGGWPDEDLDPNREL